MIDNLRYTMRAMQLFSRAQEVTANNLANLNTPGFKKDKLFFKAYEDAVYDQSVRETESHSRINMEAGNLEATGNVFDFGIQGDGFFQVEHENQRFLTRNGRFHVDSDGFLKDDNGGFVIGQTGKIVIPEGILLGRPDSQNVSIQVAKNGNITINDIEVGKIQLVGVNDIETLERRSNSYLQPNDPEQMYFDTESSVVQGVYEGGNVNPMEEMLAMTTNMRLFETSQRNMRSTDEVITEVTTRLGKF